jgi:hypothetical protein
LPLAQLLAAMPVQSEKLNQQSKTLLYLLADEVHFPAHQLQPRSDQLNSQN